MREVIQRYPDSCINKMVGMIVNGVQAGKKLRGGRFDLDDIWSYRANIMKDSNSLQQAKLSSEHDIDFKSLLVYHPDSVKENKSLFELARFNFINFLVRNFEIEIGNLNGLHQMQVSGFHGFGGAYQYTRQLFTSQAAIQQMVKSTRGVIISDRNLRLTGTIYSYKDYGAFHAKRFVPLVATQRYLPSGPAEVAAPRGRGIRQEIEQKHANDPDLYPDTQDVPVDNTMTIPIEESKPKKTEQRVVEQDSNTSEIPVEDKKPVVEDKKPATEKKSIIEGRKPIAEERRPAPDDNSTYFMPEKEPAKPTTLVTPAKSTVPTTPNKATRPVIPTKPTTPVAPAETTKPVVTDKSAKPTTPKTQQPSMQRSQTTPVQEKKVSDNGPIIYFGDGVPQQNKTNNKNNRKNQPTQNNIKDEYYNLERF